MKMPNQLKKDTHQGGKPITLEIKPVNSGVNNFSQLGDDGVHLADNGAHGGDTND